jgi:hypothetical protein
MNRAEACSARPARLGLGFRTGITITLVRTVLPSIFDLLKVKAKSVNDRFLLTVAQFLSQLIESKMDDIMMMNFLGSNFITQFKPNAM